MSDHRSILWQLNKYTPPQPEEEKKEAPLIPSPQPIREKWVDILYPQQLWDAYRDVREKGEYVSETMCDRLLTNFMASVDKVKYFAAFRSAMAPSSMRLMLLRVLVASFNEDEFPGGNLPSSYRHIATTMLGLPSTTPYNVAGSMLEHFGKIASHEEAILGRIGYLIVWQSRTSLESLIPEELRLPPAV